MKEREDVKMDLGIKINKMMLFGLGRELWMEKAPKVEIFQDCKELAPWEKLLKQLLWRQIGDVRGKRIRQSEEHPRQGRSPHF